MYFKRIAFLLVAALLLFQLSACSEMEAIRGAVSDAKAAAEQERADRENQLPSTADYNTIFDNPENNRWQNGIISSSPQEYKLVIEIGGRTFRFGMDRHSEGTFIINPRIDGNTTPYFIHCIVNDGAIGYEGRRINAYTDDVSNTLYMYQPDESFVCTDASYVDYENYRIGWSISNTLDSPKIVVKFVNAETFALEAAVEIGLKPDASHRYGVEYIKDVTDFDNSETVEKSALYAAKQHITAFDYVNVESITATLCFDIDYNYWTDVSTGMEIARANIFDLPTYAVTMTLEDNPYTNYTIYLDEDEQLMGYLEFSLIDEYAVYEREELMGY